MSRRRKVKVLTPEQVRACFASAGATVFIPPGRYQITGETRPTTV